MEWRNMKNLKTKKPYLKTNRLADVLALIQVLALDKDTHRSESGLTDELQGKPKSAKNWETVSNEHPEFFRVKTAGVNSISLVSRHVLPETNGVKELPIGFTQKLFETAIQLHDKQVKRSEKWKVWIPILAVIISGTISLIVAFGGYGKMKNENLNNNQIDKIEKTTPQQ